jgi:hypothetical protein
MDPSTPSIINSALLDSENGLEAGVAGVAAEEPRRHILDWLGITASSVCLVHCFGIPAIMLLLPVVSSETLHHHSIHLWMTALVIPLAVLAFGYGFFRHRRWSVPIVGGLGLALLLIPTVIDLHHFFHESFGVHLEFVEHLPSFVGSILVISGHLLNRHGSCPSTDSHCAHEH